MTLDIAIEVQKKVYAALTGDATLMTKIDKVYDFVPQDKPFPFIHIGDCKWNKTTTKGSNRPIKKYDGTLQLDLWDRPNPIGKKKLYDVLNEVRRILDGNRAWTASDYCLLVFDEETSTVIPEPDTVTYHGIMIFRIILGGREAT